VFTAYVSVAQYGTAGCPTWSVAKVRLGYTHPRSGALTTIDELVRVIDPEGWTLRLGEADVLCWGVMPSGRLRHPAFVERPISHAGTTR